MRLPADDPGRASERTALAWVRTGALMATIGGYGLTAAAYRSALVPGVVIAIVLGVGGCLIALRGRGRYLRRRSDERYPGTGDPVGAALVVVATLLASVLAAAVLLVER